MANGLPEIDKLKKKPLPDVNALKKKEQTQPQEEVITEDSSTVAEPLQESGGETNYLVNDTAVTKDDIKGNLDNEEFIQKVRSGEFNIEVKNDPQLQQELEQRLKPKYSSEFKEQDFFDGEFGAALKALDVATPFGIGEFIDDMGRAVAGGQKQGATVDYALYLMAQGADVSDEKIQDYIDAVEVLQTQQTSDAMYNFQKELNEKAQKNEDKKPDFFDVFSSLNFGLVPEIIVSSLSAMANPSSLAAGGTVVGGAATGGTLFGGVGAIPAAISSIPYALATAGSTLETAVTFSDLIQQDLEEQGKTFDRENVKSILEDKKKLNSIRAKAAGRGLTIGVIDALTGKLGGSVGAKIVSKSTRAAKPLAVATTATIEAVGGSAGEAAGQLVTGNELDKSEIVLEGIGEIGQAPINLASAMASTDNIKEKINVAKEANEKLNKASKVMGKPLYELNGEPISKEELNNIIESSDVNDLEGMNVVVENDNEMTSKVNDVMKLGVTKKKIQQANPNLSEDKVNEITKLQVELDGLNNNDTEVAKERSAQIKEEIKNIQNPKQERTTVEQYGDKKEVKISQEQFDEALNILEPIASERREPTLEELESVYKALGENASDVVDMAAKKDAVDLYNELTDKKKENAKRNEGQPMREQGGQEKAEGTLDSDMSKDDKAELQDGKKAEEVKNIDNVSAAKNNLSNAWEKWKQSQRNVGIIFDPKSKAKEDVELLKALIEYLKQVGAKTLQDIRSEISNFSGGQLELDDNGVSEIINILNKQQSKNQQPSSGVKKPQEKQGTATTATAEQKNNQETEEGKEKKIRRFAKSTAQTFTGLKESIESNPENYYTPQEWAKMKDRISEMTDEEVVERMSEVGLNRVKDGNDNNAVLAAIELINRRLADGKSIDDIVERFSKEGTKMGQLIAQFATLNSSTPFGVMSAISKIMEKNDKILSKEQKKRIQDLAKDMLEKGNKLKQFVKEKGGNATTEDINKMKKLRDEAEAASREFFNYTSSFTPMSWSDILSMTVQGNLLTPMSQATNVIANVSQQGLMIPVDVGKSLIDVVRGLFGKERVGSVDPRKYAAGFLGAARGLKEFWNVLTKGGADYAKGEVKRSFKPFAAASQALSGTFIGDVLGVEQGLIPKTLSKKGKELLTKAKLEESKGNLEEADNLKQQALDDAKVSLDDRLKKFYESFFGVAPEIMFRLLALGDKPFYYFTQYKNLYVEGKRKGLRGEKLWNFVMMPDAKTLEAVEKESLESVFMEDGAASRTAIHITSSVDRALKGIGKDSYFSKLVGSTLSFIFKTQVPYVKTPTNIISQTIDFAIPPVAVAKAISAYGKGDIKSGDKNIAIATTGFIIGNVAAILISEGLISSPFDFGEDKEDERNVKYDVFPPNHLNISGVQRLIEGKDPSIKAGDTTIDLRKLGILGALVLIRSSQNKRLYKEEKNNAINIQNEVSALDRMSAWAGAPMDVMKYSMEQSFLAGTASLLEALKGGQGSTQRWLTQTSRAVSSVALPNTMSAITRATDSYLYDTRQEETSKMIEALMYDRLGFTGIPQEIGVEYPIRVDMWGNDVDRTPKGRNALFYHLFDVSKAQNVPTNKLSLEVYNLYRNTLNPNTVPNLPKRTFFYEGNKYYIPKTTEGNTLLNEYAKVIGQARKRQAEKEIEKNSYKNASIEERANKMAAALARGTNSKDVLRAKKNLVKQLMQNKNK